MRSRPSARSRSSTTGPISGRTTSRSPTRSWIGSDCAMPVALCSRYWQARCMRLALVLAGLLAVAGCGGSPPDAGQAPRPADFVAQAQPTPAPAEKKPAGPRFKTAGVLHPATLRAAPAGRVIARVGRRTEFGSRRVLAVTGRRGDWLRVIASERRNEQRGWIRARAVRVGATDISIHVDRSARRLVLKRGSKVLRRMPIAVGRPGNETP